MKVILHAGLHKTGSTSIQRFLYEVETRLIPDDFCYPLTVDHEKDGGNGSAIAFALINKQLDKAFTLITELVHLGRNKRIVVISSEDFSLVKSHVMEKFVSKVEANFGEVLCITVVRPMGEWLWSAYLQKLKMGDFDPLSSFDDSLCSFEENFNLLSCSKFAMGILQYSKTDLIESFLKVAGISVDKRLLDFVGLFPSENRSLTNIEAVIIKEVINTGRFVPQKFLNSHLKSQKATAKPTKTEYTTILKFSKKALQKYSKRSSFNRNALSILGLESKINVCSDVEEEFLENLHQGIRQCLPAVLSNSIGDFSVIDPDFYRGEYSDLIGFSRFEAVRHYYNFGIHEGRTHSDIRSTQNFLMRYAKSGRILQLVGDNEGKYYFGSWSETLNLSELDLARNNRYEMVFSLNKIESVKNIVHHFQSVGNLLVSGGRYCVEVEDLGRVDESRVYTIEDLLLTPEKSNNRKISVKHFSSLSFEKLFEEVCDKKMIPFKLETVYYTLNEQKSFRSVFRKVSV